MENRDNENIFNIDNSPVRKARQSHYILIAGLALTLIVASFLRTSLYAPTDFVTDIYVEVERGDTLMEISQKLLDAHVIRSIPVFQFFVVIYGNDKSIRAGNYFFDKPQSAGAVAFQMTRGDYNIEHVRVTLPEGMTVLEMSKVFDQKLLNFDEKVFLELAMEKEGYLFPDTYFISPQAKVEEVLNQLTKNFDNKTSKLKSEFASSSHTFEDIIIMASIIEKEASGDDDREIISGILWKRISIGMPLQVDASLTYITGRDSSELTLSDLALTSEFNTYKHKDLPPTPISNPGLLSILAALKPETSPYLYYLHDSQGGIHYARNFEEHKKNKALYLN